MRRRARVLVVGAGFAGAVHARALAEAGYEVDVIDQRPHVGGNAYDELAPTGERVHRYGPHLFHTNNASVVDWLVRFGTLVPYEHRVQARLPGGAYVPLPINRATIAAVFGVRLRDAAAAQAFLRAQAEPIAHPANAAEHLHAAIGRVLTDLFFRPYTRKMWALELEELDASIVKRIPLRFDDETRYFPDDRFQLLPRDGYTVLFQAILDHPHIHLTLSQAFEPGFLQGYAHCFNSMPIDLFFEQRFGPLPYRSIRFHHLMRAGRSARGRAATVNFTDHGPLTRETDWSLLPGPAPHGARRTVTQEEPCADHENAFERYYPVKTSDGRYQTVYARYKALADAAPGLSFIGRCGTYQYLDMHQVINQSLTQVAAWCRARATAAAA